MILTYESTSQTTTLDNVPVRVWHGTTSLGTKCLVFVHRIAAANSEDQTQFEAELLEQCPPRSYVPLKFIL